MSRTAPYKAWVNMKVLAAKYNRQVIAYWLEFDNFWLSMRSTYTEGAYLSFKDNGSGAYSPNTCVWVHKNKNKRPPIHCSSNESGIKGLSLYKDAKGNKYWWVRLKGLPYKMYSFNVHGEQKAYLLASQYIRKHQGY